MKPKQHTHIYKLLLHNLNRERGHRPVRHRGMAQPIPRRRPILTHTHIHHTAEYVCVYKTSGDSARAIFNFRFPAWKRSPQRRRGAAHETLYSYSSRSRPRLYFSPALATSSVFVHVYTYVGVCVCKEQSGGAFSAPFPARFAPRFTPRALILVASVAGISSERERESAFDFVSVTRASATRGYIRLSALLYPLSGHLLFPLS